MPRRRASLDSPSMAEDNAFATNEGFIPYREVLPPPWFPPDNYYDYPGVPYVQPPTQWAPGPWDRFDPFYNEQEEQRRKKGKEIVPNRRFRNPSVWNAQSEGHGVGAYGPLPHQPWPALPPWRPALAPSMQVRYPPGRPVKHVHHDYLGPEGERRQRPPIPEAEITISRNVDGILTPNSGDLTVHLTMDVEEDLENHLDEMSRLSRLGHFLPAKAYFDENLQHHIDNPYVLVQYADLLLRQGDLKGVTLLKTEAIDKLEDERPDSAESRILRVYFELIRVLAKSYTLDNLRGLSTVFEDAVDILNAIDPDKPISSTEVGIFALTNHLMYHPVLESNRNSNWFSYGLRLAMPITTTLLYQALLRQGRIWDLHDFFVLMPTLERIKTFTHDIFKKNLISSLQAMVSDWTNSIHGYDASTTLGLLSILTHMLVAPLGQTEQECTGILKICLPLALSVMENDPSSLKSRPYLRVLLANSRFAQAASSRAMESLTRQLQCSQGIYYQADIALLPVYVPLGNENPPWTPVDQPAELKDPIKLILRSAIELGDLETEVFARRELIRLSSDPREEYNKLCALQLSQQGDLNGYGLTLASSYLTSVTKTEKEDLAAAISRLLPKVSSTDFLDASHEWVLNMLLYKIEGKSSSTIRHMLERNDANHRNMEESLLREISRKMPQLENWAEQRLQSSASSHLRSYKNKAPNESRAPIRPALRTQERTKDVSLRRQRRVSMNEQGKDPDITLISSAKPHYVSPQVSRPVPEGSTTLVDPVAVGKQGPLGQAQTGANSEITEWVSPENRPIRAVPAALASQASKKHNDDALLERQIRDKLEAEFDKRLEAEKESERERRAERAAILEELKKEVVAIRKEAVEQAERKARVEARDRAEQLIWERQNEEIKLKKEVEMAKAAVAAAELEAKLEAARKIAVREAEKKQEEETEMRKIKENEDRQQAEREISKRIEAEKRAYEEARAAERLKKELQQKAEAEKRERREDETRALEIARKQKEEAAFKEDIRQWAAEKAEKDRQIHFEDAMGRKYAVPFSQGRSWEGMQELINAAFIPVERLWPAVREGHYDVCRPDGTIILPQTWEEIIQPGWKILMKMWPMAPSDPQPPIAPSNTQSPTVPSNPQSQLAPLDQRPNGDTVDSEPDISVEEQRDDDTSSGYQSSSIVSWKPSRTMRIRNAFTALKNSILRKKRRRRDSWASTSSSGDASRSSSEAIND